LKIKLRIIPLLEIIERLKEGFFIFTTNAASKLFSGFGITILGIVASATAVGTYSAIYKIPAVLISCFSPISQALYPHICKQYKEDYKKGRATAKKVAFFVTGLFILGSILVILLRDSIVGIAFGIEYVDSSYLLLPFMIWICISVFNNFLGTQTLIASGHSKEYSKSFIIGLVTFIVLTLSLGLPFGMLGVAWAQSLSEGILMIANLVFIKKIEHAQELDNLGS
jgi:polysaccharide transporter, PST family